MPADPPRIELEEQPVVIVRIYRDGRRRTTVSIDQPLDDVGRWMMRVPRELRALAADLDRERQTRRAS